VVEVVIVDDIDVVDVEVVIVEVDDIVVVDIVDDEVTGRSESTKVGTGFGGNATGPSASQVLDQNTA